MSLELEAHVLKKGSSDLHSTLPRVISLSNIIFHPDPETKYASLAHWQSHLDDEASTIIYLTTRSTTADEYADGDLVAFLFAHPRTHLPPLHDGTVNSLHIWLAGVLPEWRKTGCLQKMMTVLMARPVPVPVYTICTIPSRFPDMWTWLGKRAWHFERENSGGRMMFSKK